MNETTRDTLQEIKTRVWSGFEDLEDINQLINDIDYGDADEPFLRGAAVAEFEKKWAAEESWPDVTDCDRLDRAFEILRAKGFVAIQDAGYTQSDGLDDVSEIQHDANPNDFIGYCFYHGQDVERAVDGQGLMLAFGSLCEEKLDPVDIARLIRESFLEAGFEVEWNGDPKTRINVPSIDWKKRTGQANRAPVKRRPWWRFW